jgi:ankyrin repeat protein
MIAAADAGPTTTRRGKLAPADDAFREAMVSAIQRFAADGEVDHLRTVLERYPEIVNARRNFEGNRKPVRTDSFAALHYAAEEGRPEAIACLLAHGADVNDVCYGGWTPLHLAAWGGHLSAVEVLVEHGARTDAKTESSPAHDAVPPSSAGRVPHHFAAVPARTPLELAREQKHTEVVEFLKSKPQ